MHLISLYLCIFGLKSNWILKVYAWMTYAKISIPKRKERKEKNVHDWIVAAAGFHIEEIKTACPMKYCVTDPDTTVCILLPGWNTCRLSFDTVQEQKHATAAWDRTEKREKDQKTQTKTRPLCLEILKIVTMFLVALFYRSDYLKSISLWSDFFSVHVSNRRSTTPTEQHDLRGWHRKYLLS